MYAGVFLCTCYWTGVTVRVNRFRATTDGFSSTFLPAYRRNFITYQVTIHRPALVITCGW